MDRGRGRQVNAIARGAIHQFATLSVVLLLGGCVATDGAYSDGGGQGYYVGGYPEAYGYDYGGWGRGYHVGPGRRGERGNERATHAYRSAPAAQRSPSIPARSRKH
jgi:hypothetical protein